MTKLILYKPLFIVHVVKDLLKSYTVVQKWTTLATKVGVAHTRFQDSVQINEVLSYNITRKFKMK